MNMSDLQEIVGSRCGGISVIDQPTPANKIVMSCLSNLGKKTAERGGYGDELYEDRIPKESYRLIPFPHGFNVEGNSGFCRTKGPCICVAVFALPLVPVSQGLESCYVSTN